MDCLCQIAMPILICDVFYTKFNFRYISVSGLSSGTYNVFYVPELSSGTYNSFYKLFIIHNAFPLQMGKSSKSIKQRMLNPIISFSRKQAHCWLQASVLHEEFTSCPIKIYVGQSESTILKIENHWLYPSSLDASI